MKKSKFSEKQIAFALRQVESGATVGEVCRNMGISDAMFFNWKKSVQKPSKYPADGRIHIV